MARWTSGTVKRILKLLFSFLLLPSNRFGLLKGTTSIFLVFIVFPNLLRAECEIPKGNPLHIRLLTSISSYSARPGDLVRAQLIAPLKCGGVPIIPAGTRVEGSVIEAHRVGMGFRRTTASLAMQFNVIALGDEGPLPFQSQITELDNAREDLRKGRIYGIRANDTPQGRINSRLIHLPTWNPYSDAFLVGFKAFFPIFPEPEIILNAGTDLRLELSQSLQVPETLLELVSLPEFSSEEKQELGQLARELPGRTFDQKHKVPADITNLLFIGREEDLRRVFQAAGWNEADANSLRSVLRTLHAFLSKSAYPTAPMAQFSLEGRRADFNFQKGLNSYAKRHHVRIWKLDKMFQGQPLWLASATHDVDATLSFRQWRFMHRVNPNIDQERDKIIRDLDFISGLANIDYVPRPELAGMFKNATREYVATDGALAVVALNSQENLRLETTEAPGSSRPPRPRRWISRYFRQQVLTFRNDLIRANLVYGVYELSRLLRAGLRQSPLPNADKSQTDFNLGPEFPACPTGPDPERMDRKCENRSLSPDFTH